MPGRQPLRSRLSPDVFPDAGPARSSNAAIFSNSTSRTRRRASAWILFFAGCLWQLDPGFFDSLRDDFDGLCAGCDCKQILSRLAWPILFLRGESRRGAVMTDDDIAWLQRHCGNAQCACINGVGHLLHLEGPGQPPALTAMLAFLDRIQRAGLPDAGMATRSLGRFA